MKLIRNACAKFVLGLVLVGGLLFLPAWTVHYPGAWLLLALLFLPMLLMFLPLPLILGSFWGIIPFALYPVVTVIRIFNEEKVLTDRLAGYAEYKKKVKYRLIPFVW